jgi:UDP-galactopyranose mutase
MKYDYLIVGSGLFGSIFANKLTKAGAKCLVVDKRHHIGGNCHTTNHDGIHVHDYGPHIFHTNSKSVWDYINSIVEFNSFVNRPKVKYNNKLYSFPINLFTLYQLWGIQTPEEAIKKLNDVKIKIKNPQNLEEWCLSQVGEEIYNTFIYGYTRKQWGRHPNELPSFIIKRLPIRLNFDDNYYEDKYQGIPIGGYTQIFKKLLKDIPVELGIDYLNDRDKLDNLANKIVYTGPIDEFFNCEHGTLEWRSLRFEHEILNIKDYQGTAAVNYTEYNVPYTRICEHKHFENGKQDFTVITKEYPQNWDKFKEKYYPINDDKNNDLYQKYKSQINTNRYIFGGRLADYKYYDMHQVVGSALVRSETEIKLS